MEQITRQRQQRTADQNKELEKSNNSNLSQKETASTDSKPRNKEDRKESKFLKFVFV